MTVIEKITSINDVIKKIVEFTQKDETISSDFAEYLSTIGAKNIPLNQIEKVIIPYIFERQIGGKSILKMYAEQSSEDKDVVKGLLDSIYSVFEIKRILKNGFELYNLVNEKTYTALSLTKMTNFRGVYAGQYIVARIFELEDEFYITEISNVLSHSQKEEAARYAVMKLIQDPRQLYMHNPEKHKEIKKVIKELYANFIKAFDTDIIYTTNKYADDIIGAFNNEEGIELSDKTSNLTECKFFHVKELDNNYSNFIENSAKGFSSHSETYDVAVIFDKDKGLYAMPFYETFNAIFDGKEVEGADECIKYFLTNDSIPDSILKRVYEKHPNFMEVINKSLGEDYTFEKLIETYKPEYLKNNILSSATVLYCSEVFSEVFDTISAEKKESTVITRKVGRNGPCPCGSGKKFKNCCMNK